MEMQSVLRNLSCFQQVEDISRITSGFSQHCFKIIADNNVYFAKTIESNTEVLATTCALESGFAPSVVYHDQDWLISHFIDAVNLALSTLPIEDKINHSIALMHQCHRLEVTLPEFAPQQIIKSLLHGSHYQTPQRAILISMADLLVKPIIDTNKSSVCCHGDLNFSNVLIDTAQRAWLVDFECACTAPIEYDLAMFIAVNELASDKVMMVIEQYQMQSFVNIDPLLLNSYLRFCYFINALWYLNSYHDKQQCEKAAIKVQETRLNRAEKQWSALQSSFKQDNLSLLTRLSSKLTNILPAFNFKNQT